MSVVTGVITTPRDGKGDHGLTLIELEVENAETNETQKDSNMALELPNKVVKFLKDNPEQKFTARKIAEWVVQNYPDECRKKQSRSTAKVVPLDTEEGLLQQIVAEIGSQRPRIQKRNEQIKTTEENPRKYYYTESSESQEIDDAESGSTSPSPAKGNSIIGEHDLYPILSEFLWSDLGIYSKRIDERRSGNSQGAGGNDWLHPDLVGIENLSGDWHPEIVSCVQEYKDRKTKLWSFEVKTKINRSNARKVFFQAVSNSSWANFGYLVASEIETTATKELRMLASRHGIGVIRLDVENPSESQILIPAKEQNEIDWDTANRLTDENKDFQKFIKAIRHFYQTGDILESDWDIIIDED
jgi:hypothetical protein